MCTRTILGLLCAAGVALLSAQASGATRFGSVVTPQTDPANAGAGRFCRETNKSKMCSWVMTLARNAPVSRVRAPKDGIVDKIRLVACAPGTFVLQVARANTTTDQASASRSGPVINYRGDPNRCNNPPHVVEVFPVNVEVKRGDRLSVVATRVGFLYCAGDQGSLLFDPPLADGAAARTAFDDGDCIMLLEAEYND
jgi:hypothetical protein